MAAHHPRRHWKREVGDPYVEGGDAFQAKLPVSACPYKAGSESEALWQSGWRESEADDKRVDRDLVEK